MPFVARLRPEHIRIAPPWRTFVETVTGLVDMLADTGALPSASRATATGAVLAREAEASTALLDIHVGVPHARFPGLRRAVTALAVSPGGLYEAVPTVAIQVVALVLSPPAATAEHLRVLTGMATLLRSDALRAALLEAAEGAEALAIIRRYARAVP
jgi:mannitol/fructose-specific phosphotransferase system IIA component (Ntr-type)